MITFNKQKDFISIIAPASASEEASRKLHEAKHLLIMQGFRVLVDKKIFVKDKLPFFASSTSERYRMFKEAMENENVKIIWAFRGGYGCSEFVFNCLNLKMTTPKILIGYSDLTILHLLLNQYYNMLSIHGSVLTSLLPPNNQEIQYIINILSGKDSVIKLEEINVNSDKIISGKIIGGNLTVFTNMLGTKLHPNTDGRILILEDINEKAYQVHRHLIHLKNAGIFKNPKAVIFGDFTNTDKFLELSLESFCQNHIPNIPAYKAAGIGHGKVNYPIIMNHESRIEDSYLSFASPFEII